MVRTLVVSLFPLYSGLKYAGGLGLKHSRAMLVSSVLSQEGTMLASISISRSSSVSSAESAAIRSPVVVVLLRIPPARKVSGRLGRAAFEDAGGAAGGITAVGSAGSIQGPV